MRRWECLDGLRGLLAVYVMLSHLAPFAPAPAWLHAALSHGGAAVDMFFMLSGLVILASLKTHGWQARPFLRARAMRLLPAYLPVLALAVAVQPLPTGLAAMPWAGAGAQQIWSQGWPPSWPADLAAHLTLTHGLFPDGVLPDAWVSFLGAAWSLSTEAQFYILALILGRWIPPRHLGWMFVAIAAAGLAWALAVPEPWRFSRAFLANKASYFALGIASAGVAQGQLRTYVCILVPVIALCVLHGGAAKALPPLAWTLCLVVQFRPQVLPAGQRLHNLLCSPVMLWLGAISYGLYLVNEPLQKLAGLLLGSLAGGDALVFSVLWWPAASIAPVLAAWGLHRWVEAPALHMNRTKAAAGAA